MKSVHVLDVKGPLLRGIPMGRSSRCTSHIPRGSGADMGSAAPYSARIGRLSLVHDLSPQDESIGILVGLIEGHHAIEMSPLGRGERWDKVLAALIHHFGAASLDYVDHDWINDEWAQGGYGADIPPVVMAFNGEALCEPAGRIHWAGTETATEALGYFEGALQSGIRATEEALADAGALGCIVTLSELPSTRSAMAEARPTDHPHGIGVRCALLSGLNGSA